MIDIETLNRAIILTKNGQIEEAENIYLSLFSENPEDPLLLSAFGLFYVNIQDFEKAIKYLEKACEIKETLGTVSALGFAEFERKNFAKSAQLLEKALVLGENPDIYNKLVLSLFQIKDYKKAVELSIKMYEKYPDNTDAISNMVKALTQSGKLFEAEKLCVGYLQEHQNSPSLWFHLGFLKELIYSDDKQACECYKEALKFGNNQAYYNIAVSYQKQKKFLKAEEYYNKMLEFYPNDMDTITSLGMCKLTQKKFKEGYDLFFFRENSFKRKMNNPWQPQKSWEKEIVVLCDQGFGDHIQFIRYLPFLQKKVEKVYVATHHPLKQIFEQNYPDIEFIDYEEINPSMQSILVTDLAYALNIDFENIPFAEGYLKSDKAEIENKKFKVGLCWEAGSAGIRTMINRTINIKLLEPFMNIENVQIYSFQVLDTLKGNEKYSDKMINLASNFKDFSDTAKAMMAMDLIISVDTSVAHLAGALGVKTFLMLPYVSDWRWFSDIKKTPWYNSVEIFKQTDPVNWEKPIEDIICKLKEYSS